MADDATVQGVVVDNMYEVWRFAGRFEGKAEVRTWVLGIARHKLLDAVRSRPAARMKTSTTMRTHWQTKAPT